MRHRPRVLIIPVIIFAANARSSNMRSNERISGTSRLKLTEKNLSHLSARTADLKNAKRHFLKSKVSVGSSEKFYTHNFENEKSEDIAGVINNTSIFSFY